MIRRSACFVAAVLALLVSRPAVAAEMVDNPQYVSWSKHKPGTNVKFKQVIAAGPMTMNNDVTETLVEVTPDKAVVETTMTTNLAGQSHETKSRRDVAAKVEKGTEGMPADTKGTIKEVGTENVVIAGKSYVCRVAEFTGESQQGKASGKVWQNADIPGNNAKMDIKVEGQMAATITMTATAIETK